MSATSSISSPASLPPGSGGTEGAAGVPTAEIDASCRPVLLLIVSAAKWLVIASLAGLIGSLKFHSPNLLADHPWLTYGRVHPAATNALVYGAAIQAGLGVLLWLVCHLGRTKLVATPLVIVGCLFWNLGVTVGVLGILAGDSTGFEWFEMPRYASALVFFGYLGIGLAGVLTFHKRSELRLSVVQWFLLAALFWFPWIYSAARLLLVIRPLRGTMQAVVASWYANNLMTIWLGFVGLGTAFHFVPKMRNRPLYSQYLGLFTFWMLALFGSWGAMPPGSPVPAWLPQLSTFGAMLTVIPILAVAVNIQQTSCGQAPGAGGPSFWFISFGMLAYVIAGLMGSVCSIARISVVTNFTWFIPAQAQLFIYGFFVMTMFGAIYYIVPRLTQTEFPSSKLVRWHFWLAAAGVVFYVVPLALGGIKQGLAMNNPNVPFLDVVKGTLMSLRMSTTGDLLVLASSLIMWLNLVGLLARVARGWYATAVAGSVKGAEVAA
jgi:cytochrome c oxidase cbb3-type subunit I